MVTSGSVRNEVGGWGRIRAGCLLEVWARLARAEAGDAGQAVEVHLSQLMHAAAYAA